MEFTRQFYWEAEEEPEYYHLRLTIPFPAVLGQPLDACTIWSSAYATIEQWRAAVQRTPGFQRTQALPAPTVAITLHRT